MTDRPEVRIESLEVTIELDQSSGEAAFAQLFAKHARRWQEALRQAEADHRFAEAERTAGWKGTP